MKAVLRHYTEVLDFVLMYPAASDAVDLGHTPTELQLWKKIKC